MYADFRSLEAISAMVNVILGAITLILASRTKNAWNEIFASKLLGWFLIFRGISMMFGITLMINPSSQPSS